MNAARLDATQRQIDRLDARIRTLRTVADRYSWARVLVFLGGGGVTMLLYFTVGAGAFAAAALVTLVTFLGLVWLHRRLDYSIRRHRLWQARKVDLLARARLDWAEMRPAQEMTPRHDHPFEADLDLVGDYSLHRLLDVTSTASGSRRLRAWLTVEEPPPAETILERQALVQELTPLALLRTRLHVDAQAVSGSGDGWQPERLIRWLEAHTPAGRREVGLVILALLAGLNLAALAIDWLGWGPRLWGITLPLYVGVYVLLARNQGSIFQEAQHLAGAVQQLAVVFRHLERFPFHNTPHLADLCHPFSESGRRPSAALRRIQRVVAATGIQGNPFFWMALNAALPWDYAFATLLNRYKREAAARVPHWLEIWFELEALMALAELGYRHPAYTLPTVTDQRSEPVLAARGLGHPLLPPESKVCNDFTLAHLGSVDIITGSNMAGKSTFLKGLAVNLVLAYAGGPVSAATLAAQRLRLYTSIKVSDSVTDGISFFYAEVKRLKGLLHALRKEDGLPLFFCIDEIFRGTNNRERLLGSRAYVEALVGGHGAGLISTHDLELAGLAESLPQVRNYHFRDAVVDGRMIFDYQLHPGPCPTTNALKIMALEGLPVPDERPAASQA